MKIGFFSDTVLDSDIRISSKILKVIKENDFNVLNLEAPFINKKCKKIKKRINLYNYTNETAFLEKNKFKYVNLANNHIFDFGTCGFKYTIEILNNCNIETFGAGLNYEDAIKPVIFTFGGKKIGIWGFSDKFSYSKESTKTNFGVAPIDIKLFNQIKKTFANIDIRIAYMHAGIEYEEYPEPYYKDLYNYLAKNDYFNIIIGNHSHSIQGFQSVSNNYIFYSLGNFIFPQKYYGDIKLSHYDISNIGHFVNISIHQSVDFEIVPYKIENNGTFIRELNNTELNKLDWNKKNDPLEFDLHKYRIFYKKNRNRKYIPLLSKSQFINTVKFRFFSFVERSIYIIIKKLGLLSIIKEIISKNIKK